MSKILVVDDSAADRFIITSMLKEYSVLTASDGFEAMHMINEDEDIALVILDLNMPKMDGFQVLGLLNSDVRYKNLRTIILTNYDELDSEIKGLKMGAVDYIRKPVHMESLRTRVNIHFELLWIQQLLEQKLNEQSLTLEAIFKQAPIGIAITYGNEPCMDNSSELVAINPMFEEITGMTKDELIKLGWEKITHPDDLEEDLQKFKKLQAGEIKSYAMEKRYIKPDGSIVWVYMVVAALALSNQTIFNHISLIQDISKRKAMEEALIESERSKSVLLSHLPGLAYRCNYRERRMEFVSDGCFKLTGYPSESLLYNKDLSFNNSLVAPEYRDLVRKEWEHALAEKLPYQYEYEIIAANGERKWVLEMGEGVYNEQGEAEALEGIVLDISNRKSMENELRYNSEHDLWTGLYNRRYFENLLRQDARQETREKRAIVGLNLSAVHSLAMTYGFHYSLELVKKVTDALKAYCQENIQLFNTYENRFVFYVRDYNDKNELSAFCASVADTLESLLAAERISGCIGIIEIDEENKHDPEQLLKNLLIASEKAVDALYSDFDFCFFDKDMEARILREDEITRELAQIAAGENSSRLFLQFQPVLELNSNQICGFEALARLNSDKYGLILPMEFIPIAEKTKLIIPLGKKIILQALCFLNTLKKKGFNTINVSINISPIQLIRHDFTKNLFEMINEMEVDPGNIGLEITESIFASNYQEINSILGKLRASGIHIAIDDFGTGYSSLARERELNITCLKIDQSFIEKLLSLEPEKAITGDIISMAHKLGHCAIAEGVEHETQLQYLIDHGCDRVQGYLISKPLDEAAAIKLLGKEFIK